MGCKASSFKMLISSCKHHRSSLKQTSLSFLGEVGSFRISVLAGFNISIYGHLSYWAISCFCVGHILHETENRARIPLCNIIDPLPATVVETGCQLLPPDQDAPVATRKK